METLSKTVFQDVSELKAVGTIETVRGPIVIAKIFEEYDLKVMEVVEVSQYRLIGEVLSVNGDIAVIQVYEDTSGVKPGDIVYGTGMPLSVELGPGLIGQVFDGIQRPLHAFFEITADIFLSRGIHVPALDRNKKWGFKPLVKVGDIVWGGKIIAEVPETSMITHKILLPPTIPQAKVEKIVSEGEYTLNDIIAVLRDDNGAVYEVKMYHRWPVKIPRPYKEKKEPLEPMLTGQRIIDMFFPIARGGTAAIPGGFGTGKTITQHQLAKWSDVDIVVYIGCGERGNEITEVLEEFPELKDPRTGKPLMERTIIIANTSNMPVTAREASVYTGITIAEYYRDMGYNVAVMADSTSRWAEALRELSGRLEEMPAEEGFPAYLASRLAAFYERAGVVITLDGRNDGSVTLIGAVSPPGGDFSEPVTQYTKRFVKTFWELDKSLASSRHFPAINWIRSYSHYVDVVSKWWEENTKENYKEIRQKAINLLHYEDKLLKIVSLVGSEVLPQSEKLVLEIGRMLREGFLQQNAYDPIDTYSTPQKQVKLLKLMLEFYERARKLIVEKQIPLFEIQNMKVLPKIRRARMTVPDDKLEEIDKLRKEMLKEFELIEQMYL